MPLSSLAGAGWANGTLSTGFWGFQGGGRKWSDRWPVYVALGPWHPTGLTLNTHASPQSRPPACVWWVGTSHAYLAS